MRERVALFVDGGFVVQRLGRRLRRFPSVKDVVGVCREILVRPRLRGIDLLRVYFYDAAPIEGLRVNPVDGIALDLGTTCQARLHRELLQGLEVEPEFAVRYGALACQGWKLGHTALRRLTRSRKPIEGWDLVPDLRQKGVDLLIGLDIAWTSIRRIADPIVLVTGDSDLVPAMKFARKEGVKVYLEPLGHPIRREMRAHSDFVFLDRDTPEGGGP